MQTLVQVICSKGSSIRDAIVKDGRLKDYELTVRKMRKPGRPHGWAEVFSQDSTRRGALKIQWDSSSSVLFCRVVNRGAGRPDRVLGDFVAFLFKCYKKRIWAINIVPDR